MQSLGYNTFSGGIQKIDNKSVRVILETVEEGTFPGSQLYLYFRMYTAWEDALDPSEFINATAFIHRYKLPQEERTESLLLNFFHDQNHIINIYRILAESWSKSCPSLTQD